MSSFLAHRFIEAIDYNIYFLFVLSRSFLFSRTVHSELFQIQNRELGMRQQWQILSKLCISFSCKILIYDTKNPTKKEKTSENEFEPATDLACTTDRKKLFCRRIK